MIAQKILKMIYDPDRVLCSTKRLKKLVLFREQNQLCSENTKNPTRILIESGLGIISRDYFSFLRRTLDCPPKLNDHERKQNEIELFRLIVRSLRGDKLSRDAETRRWLSLLEQTMFSGTVKNTIGSRVCLSCTPPRKLQDNNYEKVRET